MPDLQRHQIDIINASLTAGALKFGSYVLKSGRVSPYFFNAGLLCSGPALSTLASAYAALIAQPESLKAFGPFDVLFGPAYKGVPLVAATALVLHREHGLDIEYAYDRKEYSTHDSRDPSMFGADVRGKRVLVLDDAMTSGKAARGAIELVRREGGIVVGVAMCLDREEVCGGRDVSGHGGSSSAVQEIESLVGGRGKVKAVVRMRDLVKWLESELGGGYGNGEDLKAMRQYWEMYGVKNV